jgi:hypothetical protein
MEACQLRVFQRRVLRSIFGPKRDEATREWRRLHNEELYALHILPIIIRVIKSRRLGWAGHEASMEETIDAYRVFRGNLNEGDHLEDQGLDDRIILK